MDNNQNNSLDRISYALGLSMGHNFRASGINEINIQDFSDAVASVFYGSKPKMTIDEAKAEIQAFFTELEKKQRAQAEELAKQNQALGEAFLAENGKRENVLTLPSGLQYEVLTEGNGPKPEATDQVEVHYTGKLIDGTVFRNLRRHTGDPRMGRSPSAHERRLEMASLHPLESRLRPQRRPRQPHRPQRHSDFRRRAA